MFCISGAFSGRIFMVFRVIDLICVSYKGLEQCYCLLTLTKAINASVMKVPEVIVLTKYCKLSIILFQPSFYHYVLHYMSKAFVSFTVESQNIFPHLPILVHTELCDYNYNHPPLSSYLHQLYLRRKMMSKQMILCLLFVSPLHHLLYQ